MFSILVVEDDKNLRRLMTTALAQNGFNPLAASDAQEALNLLESQAVELMLLDVMMPGMSGFELVRTLRGAGYLFPVMLVTARETLLDKQTGFLAGADDYMVKPIDLGEMMLRVRALLRRARIASEHRLSIGGVTLDYEALSVTRDSESVTLPQKEFYLLFKLLSYPGVIFTRIQLMDEIWGMETETDDRTVDVHIRRLREKFGDSPDFEIVTIRGLGYKAQRKDHAR